MPPEDAIADNRSDVAEAAAAQSGRASSLLGPDEPPAFERLCLNPLSQVVLCCDHASNRVPMALHDLGLSATHLSEHMAWDIGSGAVTRHLAEGLQANAIFNNYSRLVIDCNRDPHDDRAFLGVSDQIAIPGNAALSFMDRQARIDAIFQPYHAAIHAELTARLEAGIRPVLLSIHTFTPQMRGQPRRTIDIGVLWNQDARIAGPLLELLRADGQAEIGDNEPYSGRHVGNYTVVRHAESRGLAHVIVEIRQDLVADAEGQQRWSRRLLDAFRQILAEPSLRAPSFPT